MSYQFSGFAIPAASLKPGFEPSFKLGFNPVLKRKAQHAARTLCVASFLLAMSAAQASVVMVLNSRDATISVLDQSTYQEIKTIPVGKAPHHLMATPDNKSLIVLGPAMAGGEAHDRI